MIAKVEEILRSGHVNQWTNPVVTQFEQRFAEVTEAIGKELNGNSKVTEMKKQDEPAEKETLAHR